MNDRYLYKAKRTDNGEWIEGYLFFSWEKAYILWGTINGVPDMVEADPSTLCQCTGLKDRNGKLIWENDIIRFTLTGETGIFEYREDAAAFMASSPEKTRTSFAGDWKGRTGIEAVGNLFDSPELLEVGE